MSGKGLGFAYQAIFTFSVTENEGAATALGSTTTTQLRKFLPDFFQTIQPAMVFGSCFPALGRWIPPIQAVGAMDSVQLRS
jgi:hypothetical protein